jgi:hypothetical protein
MQEQTTKHNKAKYSKFTIAAIISFILSLILIFNLVLVFGMGTLVNFIY